ncbi:hypothetical protein I5B93_10470 [Staphylococcus aureus]|nr:hypothetical protein I5B93_10470 [Staphylococcus aureus]
MKVVGFDFIETEVHYENYAEAEALIHARDFKDVEKSFLRYDCEVKGNIFESSHLLIVPNGQIRRNKCTNIYEMLMLATIFMISTIAYKHQKTHILIAFLVMFFMSKLKQVQGSYEE